MNLGPKNDYVNNLYIFPDPATSIESELVSHLPHKLFIRHKHILRDHKLLKFLRSKYISRFLDF